VIKISRPKNVPMRLQTAGKVENNKNCADYSADPKSYIEGTKTFEIKNGIYGDTTVKNALKAMQFSKCCFCEKDLKDEYGAVEHFRPKGGYKLTKKQKNLIKPGYYWLGYEWINLFFVCSHCNSAGNKGNLFPLLDESKRAKSHKVKVGGETPLLLDPGGRKNPRTHIIFEGQFPRGKTLYGEKTIEICGLGRDALNNMRKKLIGDIDARIAILESSSHQKRSTVAKARRFIRDSIKADAQFSATAIDYLSTLNVSFD